MLNVGEQLVSSYLRYIRQCSLTQTNLYTIESQGEIDVVGLNIAKQQVYICEVAIHLATGLRYTKNSQLNNVQKLTDKFSRDIEYARNYFDEYDQHFMLWSPIVKNPKGNPEHNQTQHLKIIQENIKSEYGIDIECIVNEKFQNCLEELRNYAKTETKPLQCPVMRLMQIEEYLDKHVSKLAKSHSELHPLHHAAPHNSTQTEKKTKAGHNEFWTPIRNGEFGELFIGKPVLPTVDRIMKIVPNTKVRVEPNITNQRCYIRLYFKDISHREEIMTLFP